MLCRTCVGAVAMIAGLCAAAPGVVADAPSHSPVTRVEVFLTTAVSLPEPARTAMEEEAAAIWRQHDVVIDWLPPTMVRTTASHRLRVLVVDQRRMNASAESRFSVGELVRPSGSHPVALVSIASARRLIASVRGRAGYELITVDDRRLGVVLGRALAHELGHYLLDTPTHAHHGLMRAQFNALEFTDLRDGAFALDEAAAAWLRRPAAGKFAYARSYQNDAR